MKRFLAPSAMSLALLFLLVATADAQATFDKPAASWEPAASANFHRGRSEKISLVVIHTTEGSFSSCINWFQNPSAQVSAHYLVSKTGQIVQFVGDGDTAYHVRAANPHALGIEHEGFDSDPSTWTDTMYRSSARLCRWLCDTYGLPLDRQHIMGHNEVPGNNHSDPGPYFNWPLYMQYVIGANTDPATAAANPGTNSDGSPGSPVANPSSGPNANPTGAGGPNGGTPGRGSTAGGPGHGVGASSSTTNAGNKGIAGRLASAAETSTPAGNPDAKHPELARNSRGAAVTELQKALVASGHNIAVDGIFGPETEAAVKAYQKQNGLAVDGIVGPNTWGAIGKTESATAAKAAPATAPAPSRTPPPPAVLGAAPLSEGP
jgi:N-acetyl-anhydromuramyl-L-alanine amidase AmpD